MQCNSHMLTGGRCDLDADHAGDHQKRYGENVYRWDDAATAREADKQGSRFD